MIQMPEEVSLIYKVAVSAYHICLTMKAPLNMPLIIYYHLFISGFYSCYTFVFNSDVLWLQTTVSSNFLRRHFFFCFVSLTAPPCFLNTVIDIKETATAVNFTLMKLISLQTEEDVRPSGEVDPKSYNLDLPSVVDVLTQYMMHNSVQTKVAVLRWIYDLFKKMPTKVSVIVWLDVRQYFDFSN